MNRSLTILIGVTIFATACGSSSSGTAIAADDGPSSPLAEFLGQPTFDPDNPEATQAAFVEEERERQDKTVACMRELGFEYIATDPNQSFSFAGPDGLEYGSDEYTAKYGLGISTQAFSQEQVGPDLVGYDDSGFEEQESNDPNQAIVEAMSESEQTAYYEALYGREDSFPSFDETLTEEEINEQMEDFDFQPSGCQNEAYAEDSGQAFYEEFNDEITEMYERAQADPRIQEQQKKVSDCVNEKTGLDFTNFDEELYEQFEQELQEIEAYGGGGFEGPEISEEEFEAMTPAEQEALFNAAGPELSDADKALLGEIQEREITMAIALQECGGTGFFGQDDLFAEIMAEYEQEFLDANADRVAEFKAE